MRFEDQFIKAVHVENVTPVFLDNKKAREEEGNGWTDEKKMRKIASIPPLVAVEAEKNFPGLFQDKNMMRRFLRSDVGKLCLTVRKGV